MYENWEKFFLALAIFGFFYSFGFEAILDRGYNIII